MLLNLNNIGAARIEQNIERNQVCFDVSRVIIYPPFICSLAKVELVYVYILNAQFTLHFCSRSGMPARPDEGVWRGETRDREYSLRIGGEPVGSIVHLEIQ